MKICYLAPHLHRPHGGIRVIIEHVNHLAKRGHQVTLHVFGEAMSKTWCKISDKVDIRYGGLITDDHDIVVATTPPLALVLNQAKIASKKFYFLQMAEDRFDARAKEFNAKALQSYKVPFPIIGISRWVEFYVRSYRADAPMYYVGNGVSTDFVPGKQDKGLTILVEGWESYGQSKDVSAIAPKVAKRLKETYGAKILAYSQFPCKTMPDVPDEFYQVPTHDQLIRLYQRSHILLKASVLDARSCAPVEAMCCGCVPVRAIHHGDDDLIHMVNCLRGEYSEEGLFQNAARLIEDESLRIELKKGGLSYAKEWLSWERWMGVIESILKS